MSPAFYPAACGDLGGHEISAYSLQLCRHVACNSPGDTEVSHMKQKISPWVIALSSLVAFVGCQSEADDTGAASTGGSAGSGPGGGVSGGAAGTVGASGGSGSSAGASGASGAAGVSGASGAAGSGGVAGGESGSGGNSGAGGAGGTSGAGGSGGTSAAGGNGGSGAASGDTFYIGTNGSDANPCTSTARCATVAGVMAKPTFGPGDLILMGKGTYTNPAINIDCSKNAAKWNGTALGRITLRAEDERQAHLTSDNGGFVFRLRNCSYWSLEGLRLSQSDVATATGDGVGNFYDGANVDFRRNLVSRNNLLNTSSSGGILFYDIKNFVIEDNEFYDYRRHAVATKYQHVGGVFRRNYCNPRGHGAVGTCFSIYPGSKMIVEDNIVESNPPYGFDSMPFGHDNVGNRWLGNIGVNMGGGLVLLHSRCDGNPDGATLEAIVRDNLSVGGAGRLLYSRSSQVVADHNSAFGGTHQAFLADQESCAPVSNSFKVSTSLALNNGIGFYATGDVTGDAFALSNVAAFGNGTNFSPASHPG
ncbi:MAG: right-handed parallel beta-helix repeat-containing protein, partial [Polyangiaceae bacterium]